jgi:hypothetical protein
MAAMPTGITAASTPDFTIAKAIKKAERKLKAILKLKDQAALAVCSHQLGFQLGCVYLFSSRVGSSLSCHSNLRSWQLVDGEKGALCCNVPSNSSQQA